MKTPSEEARLRLAVDQVTIQRDVAQKNLKHLEGVNHDLNVRRLGMYDSLMIEKLDLLCRIARIDQRIRMLNLEPALTVGSELRLDGLKNLGERGGKA